MPETDVATKALSSAIQHYEVGNFGTSEKICIGILQNDGRHADALHLLGLINLKAKRLEEAEKLLTLAIGVQKNPGYLSNLGIVLYEQGRIDDAMTAYRGALDLKPDHAEALSNLGVALQKQGRDEEAAESYKNALKERPGYPGAIVNLAKALKELARPEDAAVALHHALKFGPYEAESHFVLGLVLLIEGRLLDGWEEYEWRWKTDQLATAKPTFPQPWWNGEPAAGRTILLHCEQGLGDTIQFIRYAPLVVARGFRVVIEVPRALMSLVTAAYPGLKVIGKGDPLPAFDVHCPLLSLPRAFATTLETIPAPIPYLKADPARVEQWRDRLPRDGFRIGIVWQGTPNRDIDRGRSFPLAAFAPLAAIPGVRLISLQKTHGLDQLAQMPPDMRVDTLGPDFDTGPDAFLDTAAVVESLDLVITSDTSVAHVVGALGRPGWLLLKRVPDWRWLLDRAESPWYPSLRLFRQPASGHWADVFERVAATLTPMVAAHCAASDRHP